MARLKLAGTVQLRVIEQGTLRLSYDESSGGSASFTLIGLKPEGGQVAEVYSEDGTELLWAGLVETTPETQIGRGEGVLFSYEVTVGSYRKLARRKLATERYVSQKAGAIVRDLISKYAPQLNISLVEDGPTIADWTCNYTYPDDEIADLAQSIGFVYDVDKEKRVIFKAATAYPAPFSLTPVSLNFDGLVITPDRSQLRNVVVVRGGRAEGGATTETFSGDGIRANFGLTQEPFSAGNPILLSEPFDSLNANTWTEYDVQASNYLQVYQGSLQTTGGPAAWGQVALVSSAVWDRKAERRIEADVKAVVLSQFALGWHDGQGNALTDIVHGILFKGDGAIAAVLQGVEVALTGRTYAADTDYRIRVTLKAAGAKLEIQGGTYGAFGSRSWTTLHETATDATAYLGATPLTHHSGQARIDNFYVRDPAQGVSVKVGGALKVVGIINADEANGVDCVVDPSNKVVRFFLDTIPPAGTNNVEITYRPPIKVITKVSDPASIYAMGLIDSSDGIYEYALPPDETIATLEAAQAAGKADLALYANPVITASFKTRSPGLLPGMLLTIAVRGLNQQFRVYRVTATEIGYGSDGKMQLEYDVQGGSRLKGVEDYLRDLIRQGKRIERIGGELLDLLLTPIEVIGLPEAVTVQVTTESVGADKFGTMRFGYIFFD